MDSLKPREYTGTVEHTDEYESTAAHSPFFSSLPRPSIASALPVTTLQVQGLPLYLFAKPAATIPQPAETVSQWLALPGYIGHLAGK